MSNLQPPTLTVAPQDRASITAAGAWQVQALARPGAMPRIASTLKSVADSAAARWDLSQIAALDHIGAQLFWNAWGRTRPAQLTLAPQHEDFFRRLEQAGALALPEQPRRRLFSMATLMGAIITISDHFYGFIGLIGQLVLDLARFARAPQRGPWKEISANIYHIGYQALGITALVGFLIGVVLSYLSAQQLH